MDYRVIPYVGFDGVKLGMTIDEIRKVIAETASPFMKFEDDDFPTDAFDKSGIFAYYRKPGVCEALELHDPASPTVDGHKLIGKSYSEIKRLFQALDPHISLDDDGFTSAKYGISVYAPFARKRPKEPVEGVLIFERGYWD